MKSLIKQTIYAGLGLLGEGTDAVKNLGAELSKRADVSAVKGERIARQLQARSSKVIKSIRKTLDAEVTKGADTIHEAMRGDVAIHKSKPAATAKGTPKKVVHATRSRAKLARAR